MVKNRDQPIMLIFKPLRYAAVITILAYYAQEQELCSAYNTNYIQVRINYITDNFRKTVILECIMDLPHVLLFNDCSIRVYGSFAATCHKCRNIAINEFYIFPIILALCLTLSVIHYAQNYAGIIGKEHMYMYLYHNYTYITTLL